MEGTTLRKGLAAALLGTLALGSLGWSAPSAATVSYTGEAQVVDVNLTLLRRFGGGIPIGVDLVKAGPQPPSGGYYTNSLLTIGDPPPSQVFLTAVVAEATTAGNGFDSDSSATVARVNLGLGPSSPTALTISVALLQSFASASCSPAGGTSVSGGSDIAELVINGQAITVTGQPNQTINLSPLVKVIINEQTSSQGSGSAEITVNALRVVLLPPDTVLSDVLTGEVIISHAKADIHGCPAQPRPCEATNSCPPCDETGDCPPCSMKDFVTGGGVSRNALGKRVSFSTNGGIRKDGSLRNGHLNAVDHGTGGPHIRSTAFLDYIIPNSTTNTRKLVYACEGSSGSTCTVTVTDNGEPGTNDKWHLATNGGYSAGSLLGSIEHGNIQLHKPRGCSAPPKPCKGKKCR